jgi:hypothetical protein
MASRVAFVIVRRSLGVEKEGGSREWMVGRASIVASLVLASSPWSGTNGNLKMLEMLPITKRHCIFAAVC